MAVVGKVREEQNENKDEEEVVMAPGTDENGNRIDENGNPVGNNNNNNCG